MITRDKLTELLDAVTEENSLIGLGILHPPQLDAARLRQVYQRWLEADNRTKLSYVEESLEERTKPFESRPWAASAMVALFAGDWGNEEAELPIPRPAENMPAGLISQYALGIDYHKTGRNLMNSALEFVQDEIGDLGKTEICLDTSATPDTALAAAAGLGEIGFNHLLRTTANGSRVFVVTAFLSRKLPVAVSIAARQAVAPACNECGKCIAQCPTGALDKNTGVKLALCRSYLTIEHRDAFNQHQAQLIGDILFGCDVCTAACPPAQSPRGVPVDLDWLLRATAGEVKRSIQGTALAYTGVTRLRRNAVAILARHYQAKGVAAELLNYAGHNSRSPVVQDTLAGI
ncbi:MAG: 4Fe-4S double cluster binding domain-containing protein [Lentisphaeria bacterium]